MSIQLVEEDVFETVFTALENAGWRVTACNTGPDEEWVHVSSIRAAKREVFSVEDASVEVTNDKGRHHYILIVLGNGADLVCDYTTARDDVDGFDTVMDDVQDLVERLYA